MRSTGLLEYQVRGRLQVKPGTLVVANHPSLIDVIFIVAHLPDTICVVKEALARNLFTRAVVRATGYLTSATPGQMIHDCVQLLSEGATILMFPEGTRTVSGQPLTFRHGAARVLCRALCPLTPIFLRISPPTLAKGQAWFRVPDRKVRYVMEVGDPLAPVELIESTGSERRDTKNCTERLQSIFAGRIAERPGADGNYGQLAGRN
jgi:1-acyl-sn-glycerol-3-phosphate acyltransferase